MRKIAVVMLAVVMCAGVRAQSAEPGPVVVSLLAPTDTVAMASEVQLTLVALNPSDAEVAYTVTAPIIGRIVTDKGEWPVELRLEKAALPTIAATGFVSRNYLVTLPPQAQGRAVLELTYPQRTRAVIDISASSAPVVAQTALPVEAKAPLADAPAAPAIASIARTFPGRFSAHQPIYFAYGLDAPAVKFQFSMKYRLLASEGSLGSRYPLLQGIHVAYTQRSLWDIQANSSPFFDTSYMPELMYEVLAPAKTRDDGGFQWLGAQVALQHESNGRDGVDSRSVNMLYVRPMIAFGRVDGWRAIFAPKIYAYLGTTRENPDVAKYRGYSDLMLAIGKNDGLAVTFTGRVGSGFDHGSLEVNATYPLKAAWGQFATYGFVQYFTGYGESILYYNEKSSTVRAGFSFIR